MKRNNQSKTTRLDLFAVLTDVPLEFLQLPFEGSGLAGHETYDTEPDGTGTSGLG